MNKFLRFLLILAFLRPMNSGALSPATAPLWATTINFEGDASSLTEAQLKKLDEIGKFIDERCIGLWEAPAWLQIEYFLLLTPDPRTDYQQAGARTEFLFHYLKKFDVKLPSSGGVRIEIVTTAKTEKRNHSAQVLVSCKTRIPKH